MVSRIRSIKWWIVWLIPALLLLLGLFGGTTHAPLVLAQAPTAPVPTPVVPQVAYTLNVMRASSGTFSYLADATGEPQYTYSGDVVGSNTLTCTDVCASNNPPLKVQAGQQPTLDPNATGAIGTIALADGSVVVTYNGMPLYGYNKAGTDPPLGFYTPGVNGTFTRAAP